MPPLLQNLHILTNKAKETYFDEQKAITLKDMGVIKLKEDIIVLNNVTKFHKIQIKTI